MVPMKLQQTTGPGDPVATGLLARFDELRGEAAALDLEALGATGCTDLVAALTRVQNWVGALQARAARVVTAHPATVRDIGATSTTDLFAKNLGGDRQEAGALARRAERLTPASQVEAAFTSGTLTPKQVDVIGSGLSRLPSGLPESTVDECERVLIEAAQRYPLRDLRRQADRICETYLPPVEADQHEADLTQSRADAALRATWATLVDLRDGSSKLTAVLPTLPAQMLKTALDSLGAPRRAAVDASLDTATDSTADAVRASALETAGESDEADRVRALVRRERGAALADAERRRDPRHRLGLALVELLTHLPTDALPTGAGTGAQLVVTISADSLLGQLEKVGITEHGQPVAPDTVRRLACNADLMPAVLDGRSQPLDLGRSRRLFSRAQRHTLALRDQGCTFPGCDRPPGWTEAHHLDPWRHGGPTDLTNAALLCARHHHDVHDQHWQGRLDPDTGHVQWRRHAWREWQTNLRYRPADRRPGHQLAA